MSEGTTNPVVTQVSLNENLNGGKVIDFVYDRNLNSLVSDWSAKVYGGTFVAGNTITFQGAMTNGYILRAYVDSDGFWQLSGKDAGIRLMRTLPIDNEGKNLPKNTGIIGLIRHLATFCGLTLTTEETEPSGFNKIHCRCLVSGQTCAEAIAELALYGGMVCYITNSGKLCVTTVSKTGTSFDDNTVIEDNNSVIDSEGYADYVTVNLARDVTEDDETEKETIGESPSFSTKVIEGTYTVGEQNTYFSGIDDILDDYGKKGIGLTGSYKVTLHKPLGFVTNYEAKVKTDEGLQITFTEEHNYDIKTKTKWRGEDDEDQTEVMMVAFAESNYKTTKEVKGKYTATFGDDTLELEFTETTTEEMHRYFKKYDEVNELSIPYQYKVDWSDVTSEVLPVSEETILRYTKRTGQDNDPIPNNDYPLRQYTPPFDSNIRRVYRRFREHRNQTMIVCSEVEVTYKAEDVGTITALRQNDKLLITDRESATVRPLDPSENSATTGDGAGIYSVNKRVVQIRRAVSKEWVAVYKYKITFDRYDKDGNPIYTATYSWDDGGQKWYVKNGLYPKDTTKMSQVEQLDWLYEQCYAKFTTASNGVQVTYGQSSITSPWNYRELEGKRKIVYNKEQGLVARFVTNIEDWFDFVRNSPKSFDVCPFYDGGECSIYALHEFPGQENTTGCYYEDGQPWPSYTYCARVKEAIKYVKENYSQDINVDTDAVKAVAGETTTAVSGFEDYQFSVETISGKKLSDEDAQSLANTLAENILKVKKSKGVMKVVAVPYDTSKELGKAIRGIRYDWGNLRTEYTYFADETTLPSFLGTNIANLSAWVTRKENIKQNRVVLGKVVEIDEKHKIYTVMIRGSEKIQCRSKIGNILSVNDTVVINRSSGYFGKGVIISLL